ncbi:MAG: helix-turn-helix transcriptional regulator [Muribaculaceae bacterium]|nr:helix-turn-helix transcriptional regulator [Muribaculaceae bacterium]
MEDFPVASRLKTLIEALGLSDSQFADKCEISRSTLSLILSGKNKKISDVMLSQIHSAFPEVSILWILFGEGDKFSKEENQSNINQNIAENSIFQDNSSQLDEQLNLVSLNQLENIIKDIVNKSFNHTISTLENLVLKTSEPSSLRKVSKITVYYGDSTFETFVPE